MTRKCRDMEAWLSAYLENELSGKDAAEVENHLIECAACRAKKEKMEELLQPLRSSGGSTVLSQEPPL